MERENIETTFDAGSITDMLMDQARDFKAEQEWELLQAGVNHPCELGEI